MVDAACLRLEAFVNLVVFKKEQLTDGVLRTSVFNLPLGRGEYSQQRRHKWLGMLLAGLQAWYIFLRLSFGLLLPHEKVVIKFFSTVRSSACWTSLLH